MVRKQCPLAHRATTRLGTAGVCFVQRIQFGKKACLVAHAEARGAGRRAAAPGSRDTRELGLLIKELEQRIWRLTADDDATRNLQSLHGCRTNSRRDYGA